ncbi:MAG: hypothetical protein WCF85_19820, partial [Rhodospirillaceae bacterium]
TFWKILYLVGVCVKPIGMYHSFRRNPDRKALATIEPLYRELLAIEDGAKDSKTGMNAAVDTLFSLLKEKGTDYDHFVLSL